MKRSPESTKPRPDSSFATLYAILADPLRPLPAMLPTEPEARDLLPPVDYVANPVRRTP